MNKQQWEDLAAFAGIKFQWRGSPEVKIGQRYYCWLPDSEWGDFGPLWRKLDWWLAAHTDEWINDDAMVQRVINWQEACEDEKLTDAEFMLAGCELGAAIGAAMRQPTGEIK